jgi:hypothetical protein
MAAENGAYALLERRDVDNLVEVTRAQTKAVKDLGALQVKQLAAATELNVQLRELNTHLRTLREPLVAATAAVAAQATPPPTDVLRERRRDSPTKPRKRG